MGVRMIPRAVRQVMIVLLVLAGLVFSYYGGMRLLRRSPMLNFEVVDKGRLLRTAQPRSGDLDRILATEGIGTILSLRGSEEPDVKQWAKAHDVQRVAIQMWADHPPTDAQIGLFFDIMRGDTIVLERYGDIIERSGMLHGASSFRFRFPVLIHCEGGSDRTGVMVGLFRLAFQGWDLPICQDDMRARWHFPSMHPAQFRFLEKMAGRIDPRYGSRLRAAPARLPAPSPAPVPFAAPTGGR